MARRMKSARNARAMRDIEKGLRMLTTGLRRLARDLSSVRSAPAAPAVVATRATTAAAAGRTFFARTRDVNRQGATVKFLAVQGLNRLLGFLL